MAIEKVRAFFKKYKMDDRIKEFEVSSATVELAAQALNCPSERIAKSLSFDLDKANILVITAGDAKIDNAKYKNFFGKKARMLNFEEVESRIGHAVGGVCPFGINDDVKVYLDETLKRFKTVFPACGSSNSAIELTIEELEKYSNYMEWIDVCKEIEERDLYDINQKVTNLTYKKGSSIPDNYYGMMVSICIQNSEGKFLMQKRSLSKGGKWANTGGHPKKGQSSLEGIIEEVNEELKIDISNDDIILFKSLIYDKNICHNYYLKKDINLNDIKLQETEVDDIGWFSIDEIEKMIEDNLFHQGHILIYKNCLEYLKNN